MANEPGSQSIATARYSAVAMVLHWAIAGLILYQIALGLWMSEALEAAEEARRFAAYETVQQHKALGLTVLALSILRLVWRLARPAPPLPRSMPPLERLASALSHWAFYGLMLAMPLSGWAMISTSPEFSMVPTGWFGLFTVPHLPADPLVAAAASSGLAADTAGASAAFAGIHEALAYGALALLALHVAAALRHHYILGDGVLARMVPGLRPRDPEADMPVAGRAGAAGRGLAAALALASCAGLVWLYLQAPTHEPAGMSGRMAAGAEAAIARWTPIHAESRIGFTGKHAGVVFSGVFERWRAEIAFDPDRLAESRAAVEIEVASARTGSMQYDGSLPSADWFDAAAHPVARFVADRFVAGDGPGRYVAEGRLTLRGVAQPATLPFALRMEGDRARVSGETVIDRLDHGVGATTDPQAAWVSREIAVTIELLAAPATAPGD